MEETDALCTPSTEESVIDIPEQAAEQERRRKLAMQVMDKLTDIQRRRYIQYHVEGLTVREIAEKEGSHFTSVHESLLAAEKKIKKVLTNG